MEVVLCGTGTLVPQADRASSCVAVVEGEAAAVFDLGRNALSRLVECGIDVLALDQFHLTHIHPDHCGELVALLFAGNYAPGPRREESLRLVGPPGVAELVEALGKAWSWVAPGFPLEIVESTGGAIDHDHFTMESRLLVHGNTPDLGYRVTSRLDTSSVVFTGDTGPCEALVALADGCDVLVAECAAGESDDEARAFHLCPSDLGRMAAESRCGKLVVTHLYPGTNPEVVLEGIARLYSGPVVVAEDRMRLPVV